MCVMQSKNPLENKLIFFVGSMLYTHDIGMLYTHKSNELKKFIHVFCSFKK